MFALVILIVSAHFVNQTAFVIITVFLSLTKFAVFAVAFMLDFTAFGIVFINLITAVFQLFSIPVFRFIPGYGFRNYAAVPAVFVFRKVTAGKFIIRIGCLTGTVSVTVILVQNLFPGALGFNVRDRLPDRIAVRVIFPPGNLSRDIRSLICLTGSMRYA